MIRMLIGWILLVLGAIDLWKFGWHLLLATPQLIFGVLLIAAGGAMLGSGHRLGRGHNGFLP